MNNRNSKMPGLYTTKTLSVSENIGDMYLKIFKLYLDMSAWERAIVYGEKAMGHFQQSERLDVQEFILQKLGDLYDFFGMHQKAILCYGHCQNLQSDRTQGDIKLPV